MTEKYTLKQKKKNEMLQKFKSWIVNEAKDARINGFKTIDLLQDKTLLQNTKQIMSVWIPPNDGKIQLSPVNNKGYLEYYNYDEFASWLLDKQKENKNVSINFGDYFAYIIIDKEQYNKYKTELANNVNLPNIKTKKQNFQNFTEKEKNSVIQEFIEWAVNNLRPVVHRYNPNKYITLYQFSNKKKINQKVRNLLGGKIEVTIMDNNYIKCYINKNYTKNSASLNKNLNKFGIRSPNDFSRHQLANILLTAKQLNIKFEDIFSNIVSNKDIRKNKKNIFPLPNISRINTNVRTKITLNNSNNNSIVLPNINKKQNNNKNIKTNNIRKQIPTQNKLVQNEQLLDKKKIKNEKQETMKKKYEKEVKMNINLSIINENISNSILSQKSSDSKNQSCSTPKFFEPKDK